MKEMNMFYKALLTIAVANNTLSKILPVKPSIPIAKTHPVRRLELIAVPRHKKVQRDG
jgi:hypothetical protein